LATQKSISRLNEWLDTTRLISPVSGDPPKMLFALRVIEDLQRYILNEDFLAYLKPRIPFFSEEFNDKSLVLYCKNWLIDIEGKYQIRKFF
jgi:hypothetical protein